MNTKNNCIASVLSILLLIGCALKTENTSSTNKGTKEVFNKALGIEPVPSSLGKSFTNNFNRYTKVVAPNGKPIHMVVQDDLTEEQIVRCRGILEHFLKDYPGSKYGSDKSAIANQMADNEAILAILNGQDDGKNPVEVKAQYLFKNEIQVEGHSWYTNQNYEHRDAAFEEILHFVHDNGIGVDGPNTRPGAAPEFQKEIRAAQVFALENKLWADSKRAEDWIKELAEENSLSQEYLASLIDSYYGLWGAWDSDESKGMWGLYVSQTRDEIKNEDLLGHELMNNKFFHPYLTYNARIDKDFTGTFSLAFDAAIPYTHHSQYLKDITLFGSRNTNVKVNELDNDITGNEGVNAVIFSGNADEYEVRSKGNAKIVEDKIVARDGSNILRKIENIQFSDRTIDIGQTEDLNKKIGGFLSTKPYNDKTVDVSDITVNVEKFDMVGFPQKMQTYGTIFAAMPDVPETFLHEVATTLHEMFPQDPALDLDTQHKILNSMLQYRSVIPVLKGRYESASEDVNAGLEKLSSDYAVCDIIMYKDGTGRQTMEVMEHLLHFITDIGFHTVLPNEWSFVDPNARVNEVMKKAIELNLYDVSGYADILEEDQSGEVYQRVLVQEFAYWLITTYWNLQEPYGPREDEWKILNKEQLLEKLPEGYNLVQSSVDKIMRCPSPKTLSSFMKYN